MSNFDPEQFYRPEGVPDQPIDGTFAVIVPVKEVGYLAISCGPAGEWVGAGAAKTPTEALIQLTAAKLELDEPVEVESIPVEFASLDEPVEDFGNPEELELDDADVPEYEPDDPYENPDFPS